MCYIYYLAHFSIIADLFIHVLKYIQLILYSDWTIIMVFREYASDLVSMYKEEGDIWLQSSLDPLVQGICHLLSHKTLYSSLWLFDDETITSFVWIGWTVKTSFSSQEIQAGCCKVLKEKERLKQNKKNRFSYSHDKLIFFCFVSKK